MRTLIGLSVLVLALFQSGNGLKCFGTNGPNGGGGTCYGANYCSTQWAPQSDGSFQVLSAACVQSSYRLKTGSVYQYINNQYIVIQTCNSRDYCNQNYPVNPQKPTVYPPPQLQCTSSTTNSSCQGTVCSISSLSGSQSDITQQCTSNPSTYSNLVQRNTHYYCYSTTDANGHPAFTFTKCYCDESSFCNSPQFLNAGSQALRAAATYPCAVDKFGTIKTGQTCTFTQTQQAGQSTSTSYQARSTTLSPQPTGCIRYYGYHKGYSAIYCSCRSSSANPPCNANNPTPTSWPTFAPNTRQSFPPGTRKTLIMSTRTFPPISGASLPSSFNVFFVALAFGLGIKFVN